MRRNDQGRFEIRLGGWMDAHDGPLPRAFYMDTSSVECLTAEDAVDRMRDWGWNPWEFESHHHASWPNASVDFMESIVAIQPLVMDGIWIGTAVAVAERVTSKLLEFIGDTFSREPFTLDQAMETAMFMLVNRSGLALNDLRQVSAEKQDDGSYVLMYHDGRRRQSHLVRVSKDGVAAHANLEVIEQFIEKRRREG